MGGAFGWVGGASLGGLWGGWGAGGWGGGAGPPGPTAPVRAALPVVVTAWAALS
jgi:hypothetical protein